MIKPCWPTCISGRVSTAFTAHSEGHPRRIRSESSILFEEEPPAGKQVATQQSEAVMFRVNLQEQITCNKAYAGSKRQCVIVASCGQG